MIWTGKPKVYSGGKIYPTSTLSIRIPYGLPRDQIWASAVTAVWKCSGSGSCRDETTATSLLGHCLVVCAGDSGCRKGRRKTDQEITDDGLLSSYSRQDNKFVPPFRSNLLPPTSGRLIWLGRALKSEDDKFVDCTGYSSSHCSLSIVVLDPNSLPLPT